MSEVLVKLENVHKEFVLSHSGASSIKTLLLWWKRRSKEKLNALNGISFEVKRGESVALIGRNGAGKSTTLSLISRIYKATSGTVTVNGRLAPLLELGAGFHPDLTGLDNVLFNGMIMGLTRKQVTERLPQIIAFAELDKHIDAPVRTYSSGMLARLGFAVAVHVDADVLIVDEVLAVGDFTFEKKCYDFIDQFRKQGGTILFVSHNAESVKRVADRCVWLKGGLVHMDGDPESVLASYQADAAAPNEGL
ncbi:MAG: ABC transporter ATP-binding protein [Armatimonadetes bacterium]|nr:ABC transporter ATP-binding protein [Armatimonadota bacterium]